MKKPITKAEARTVANSQDAAFRCAIKYIDEAIRYSASYGNFKEYIDWKNAFHAEAAILDFDRQFVINRIANDLMGRGFKVSITDDNELRDGIYISWEDK